MQDTPPVPPQPDDVETGDVPLGDGPVVPSPAVRAELENLLERDSTALGDVYRRTRAGETPEQIQEARGTEGSSFVWNYMRTVRALLDGNLPTAPTVALTNARRFRRILSEGRLSPEATNVLEANLVILQRRATSEVDRVIEDNRAIEATEQAEAQAIQGIYVYALPHYLRYPYEEETDRTLMKVGRSDSSVIRRFREQTRTTALPEEPVLLRIYPTQGDEALRRERQFHELLEAADHARSRARTAGREWFSTSLRFLDAVASTIGLEIRQVYDPDVET